MRLRQWLEKILGRQLEKILGRQLEKNLDRRLEKNPDLQSETNRGQRLATNLDRQLGKNPRLEKTPDRLWGKILDRLWGKILDPRLEKTLDLRLERSRGRRLGRILRRLWGKNLDRRLEKNPNLQWEKNRGLQWETNLDLRSVGRWLGWVLEWEWVRQLGFAEELWEAAPTQKAMTLVAFVTPAGVRCWSTSGAVLKKNRRRMQVGANRQCAKLSAQSPPNVGSLSRPTRHGDILILRWIDLRILVGKR